MTATYIRTEAFQRLADKIAALEPCPFYGYVTPDQIKMALGEHGNIWPTSVHAETAVPQSKARKN